MAKIKVLPPGATASDAECAPHLNGFESSFSFGEDDIGLDKI